MTKRVRTPRLAEILELLQAQQSITIAELSEQFNVSAMTIHRDLDWLEQDGRLRKVRGGAVLPTTGVDPAAAAARRCAMCGRMVVSRTAWTVTPAKGPQWHACCAHCGLLELQRTGDSQSVLATDFIYGRMVNAVQAAYVVGSDITLCCAPSTLCFASRADAEKFSLAFGGDVFDFESALAVMSKMHGIH